MEVKKSKSAGRTRGIVAVLLLAVIAGAFSLRAHKSIPVQPGGDEQHSPGLASGVKPQALPGISLIASGQSPTATGVQKQFVAQPTLTQLQTAWKQSTIRMKYLQHCANVGNCTGFDNSEAYSYDLDVRQQTAREINDFEQIAKSWMASHAGELPAEAQAIAVYFLKNGNDDVKDAAIQLIDLVKPTIQNMQTVVAAVEHSSSGPLLKVFLASQLAKSCGAASFASSCVGLVERTARKGSDGQQKVLARESYAIYNAYTAAALMRFEQSESPRSKKRFYLRVNREEYQRFQSNG